MSIYSVFADVGEKTSVVPNLFAVQINIIMYC